MAGEIRNDGPTLSLFEGGVRLSLHESAVNVAFAIKDDQGGKTAVANFALDLPNLVFLARSLMSYAELVQPLVERQKVPVGGPTALIPLDQDGTCPQCDSAAPISAEGDVRRCGSCNYVWRVK